VFEKKQTKCLIFPIAVFKVVLVMNFKQALMLLCGIFVHAAQCRGCEQLW